MKRASGNLLTLGLLVAAIASSFIWLQLDLSALLTADGRSQMYDYAAAFFPPDTSQVWLLKLWRGALETLAISAIGTLLAALFGAFGGVFYLCY